MLVQHVLVRIRAWERAIHERARTQRSLTP
jgi:hypothetical protein